MDIEIATFAKGIGAREHTPRIYNQRDNYFVLNEIGIIVKISRSPNPFWGLGKFYVDIFNKIYPDYFLVLLTSPSEGWYFDKATINTFIAESKWKLSQSDYKIHSSLPSANRFRSHQEFMGKSGIAELMQKPLIPEEILSPTRYSEGATHKVALNVYERNAEARTKCVEYYGHLCFVCSFDFSKNYGSIGSKFIHVHHLKPLSEINGSYELNPITDLRPVCPNCHAMIHRKSPPYSIEELRQIIERNRC